MYPVQQPLASFQHSPQHLHSLYPQYMATHPSVHPPMVHSGMLPPNTLPPFSSLEGATRHSPQQQHMQQQAMQQPQKHRHNSLPGPAVSYNGSPLPSPGSYGNSGSPHSLGHVQPHNMQPSHQLSPTHPHHAHAHHPTTAPHHSPHQSHHRVKVSSSSNVTSADSSDNEAEFPASGLHAPLEAIRAIANAVDEEGHLDETESLPDDRTRSISPSGREKSDRPQKRRKISHRLNKPPPLHAYPDVVSKGIITEAEARDLFDMCVLITGLHDVD